MLATAAFVLAIAHLLAMASEVGRWVESGCYRTWRCASIPSSASPADPQSALKRTAKRAELVGGSPSFSRFPAAGTGFNRWACKLPPS